MRNIEDFICLLRIDMNLENLMQRLRDYTSHIFRFCSQLGRYIVHNVRFDEFLSSFILNSSLGVSIIKTFDMSPEIMSLNLFYCLTKTY